MHLFINVCNIEEIGTITCLPAFNRNCVSNIYRTSLSRKSFRFNARASAHQRTLCEIHYIHWSMNKVSQLVRLVLIECSLGGIEAKKKIRKKYMKRRYPRVHEDWWNLRSWGMLRLHNEISIRTIDYKSLCTSYASLIASCVITNTITILLCETTCQWIYNTMRSLYFNIFLLNMLRNRINYYALNTHTFIKIKILLIKWLEFSYEIMYEDFRNKHNAHINKIICIYRFYDIKFLT